MLKNHRLLTILLVAALSLLLLAACGGDRDEEPAAAEAPAAAAAPAEEVVEVAAAPAGDAVKGKELFDTTCIACHGPGGVGVVNLGKDMTASVFIHGLDDQGLLDFIKVGRDASHPDNTTGVAMLPKGGNPALTDEDLLDIIAYIRTINMVQ